MPAVDVEGITVAEDVDRPELRGGGGEREVEVAEVDI